MGLSIYYGRNDYPVKCQLYFPIYSEDGETIDWQPSDKFCWCKEIQQFGIDETRESGRRIKMRKGALETISLKQEEITIDWKIKHDDVLYRIERMTQEDDTKQQVMLKNGSIVKTRLYIVG